jgi:hypothetical protein
MTEFTRRHPVCHCGALPLIFDDTVEARCPLPYNCKSRAEKWPREEAQESRISPLCFVSDGTFEPRVQAVRMARYSAEDSTLWMACCLPFGSCGFTDLCTLEHGHA